MAPGERRKAGRITERRAARAARQLLHHRGRLRWMAERVAENEGLLEGYLAALGEGRALLPGGYAVEAVGETLGEGVAVMGPSAAQTNLYEQLRLGPWACRENDEEGEHDRAGRAAAAAGPSGRGGGGAPG